MSITFGAKDSPRGTDRVYTCCDRPECPECKGTNEVRFETLEYEADFSNSNAWPLTALFTPDGQGEYCGCVEAGDVPAALNKLQGLSADNYRIPQLCRIFTWAADNNKPVYWL